MTVTLSTTSHVSPWPNICPAFVYDSLTSRLPLGHGVRWKSRSPFCKIACIARVISPPPQVSFKSIFFEIKRDYTPEKRWRSSINTITSPLQSRASWESTLSADQFICISKSFKWCIFNTASPLVWNRLGFVISAFLMSHKRTWRNGIHSIYFQSDASFDAHPPYIITAACLEEPSTCYCWLCIHRINIDMFRRFRRLADNCTGKSYRKI